MAPRKAPAQPSRKRLLILDDHPMMREGLPGGGVVVTNEELPFLAPETGYASSAEINMLSDRTDWSDDVTLKFYYRLADGRYGRMAFSMIAHGQHFCMIDSVLNPSGSRNLEPGN